MPKIRGTLGTVTQEMRDGNFGFIIGDDGERYFFWRKQFKPWWAGRLRPTTGMRVAFDPQPSDRAGEGYCDRATHIILEQELEA
jgi:hypothetical protein